MIIITRRDMGPLLNAYLAAAWSLFVALVVLFMTMAMGIFSIIMASPFFIFSFLNIRNYYKKAPIIKSCVQAISATADFIKYTSLAEL